MTHTLDSVGLARSLLAQFRSAEKTPAMWLLTQGVVDEVRASAGAYLYPTAAPSATFLGLPYKIKAGGEIELLTRDSAVKAGHLLP